MQGCTFCKKLYNRKVSAFDGGIFSLLRYAMYFFKKDRRQSMKNTNLTRAAASLLACGMVLA